MTRNRRRLHTNQSQFTNNLNVDLKRTDFHLDLQCFTILTSDPLTTGVPPPDYDRGAPLSDASARPDVCNSGSQGDVPPPAGTWGRRRRRGLLIPSLSTCCYTVCCIYTSRHCALNVCMSVACGFLSRMNSKSNKQY